MLLPVTPAMAQPEIADSMWRDDDRVWGMHRMKITQNMAAFSSVNNWELAEQSLTERHKAGIFLCVCLQKWLAIFSREGVHEGKTYCLPYVSIQLTVSKRMTDKRELLGFFLLNYGHKYRRLEIITNPFSSLPEVVMLKFGLVVLYLEAQQVYSESFCVKKCGLRIALHICNPD